MASVNQTSSMDICSLSWHSVWFTYMKYGSDTNTIGSLFNTINSPACKQLLKLSAVTYVTLQRFDLLYISMVSAVVICFNSAFWRSAVKAINRAFILKGLRSSFPDCIKVIKSSAFADDVVKIDNQRHKHIQVISSSELLKWKLINWLNRNCNVLTKYGEKVVQCKELILCQSSSFTN